MASTSKASTGKVVDQGRQALAEAEQKAETFLEELNRARVDASLYEPTRERWRSPLLRSVFISPRLAPSPLLASTCAQKVKLRTSPNVLLRLRKVSVCASR